VLQGLAAADGGGHAELLSQKLGVWVGGAA
jgi:hypothetical protein